MKGVGEGIALGLRLRLADGADIAAVARLQARCNPVPWGPKLVGATLLAPATIAVVAVRGAIVGYLLAQRLPDEWHVLDLGVAPEARRLGIGREMLVNLLEVTDRRGAPSTLEVRVSNTAAISLYEAMGFASHGRRPSYYSDNGEDAEIMWRPARRPQDAT